MCVRRRAEALRAWLKSSRNAGLPTRGFLGGLWFGKLVVVREERTLAPTPTLPRKRERELYSKDFRFAAFPNVGNSANSNSSGCSSLSRLRGRAGVGANPTPLQQSHNHQKPKNLNAPPFLRTTTVVRNRRHVPNRSDFQAARLDRADRSFASAARPFDEDVDAFHARFGGAARQIRGRDLGREGRAFFGALEPDGARRGPTKRIAFTVGDGDDGIVERALDEDLAASRSFLRTP